MSTLQTDPAGERSEAVDRPLHVSQGGPDSAAALPAHIALAPVLLMAVAVGAIIGFGAFDGLPVALRLSILTPLVIVALWLVFRPVARDWKRGVRAAELDFEPDLSTRVRVICWPDQAEAFGSLEDEAFEPELFRLWIPQRPPRPLARWMARHPQAAASLRGMIWFLPVLLVQLADLLPGWIVPVALTLLLAEGLFALWLIRKPTYLRIVPGRADLLRYPMFGRASPDAERLDLRSGPVWINARARTLAVEDAEPLAGWFDLGRKARAAKPRGRTVRFGLTGQDDRILRTLARAAISSAEPPALPDRELVG